MILFVGVSDKKGQQTAINVLKNKFKTFKETVGKSNKMIIKEESLLYGMDEELQKLLDKREELVNKLCREVLALEGIKYEE